MAVDHRQAHADADRLWRNQGARRCSTCKTPVVFAKNAKSGKTMILDARPDWAKGNVFVHALGTGNPLATVWNVTDAESNRTAGVPFYIDHHATCPYADQHRRAK